VLQTVAFSIIEILGHRIDDLAETEVPQLARQLMRPNDGDTERLISVAVPLLTEAGIDIGAQWFGPSPRDGSLRDRAARWCQYRNNRPAHGVVSEDVREEALSWLPQLAEDLVTGLEKLLPLYSPTGGSVIRLSSTNLVESIKIPTVCLEDGRPVVIRQLQQRANHWYIRGQLLDPVSAPEITVEFTESELTRLLVEACSRYRQLSVRIENEQYWRPTVLLPARQTDTFEGRTEQLRELSSWLSDPDSRACNLYGEGGIGKTTLVLELLNRIIEGDYSTVTWRPEVICFFSAKLTRWGPDGLVFLKGVAPPIEDAIRALAAVYEEPKGREWHDISGDRIISKVETLLHDLGLRRNEVLLVLDNTETLARSADDELKLAEAIEKITKRLARVLITSRRRERMEARPIEVPPLSLNEAQRLASRLAESYGAAPILQAGDPGRRKLVSTLGCLPIKIEACCRLVGRFGYKLERAQQQVLADSDLGRFLYDDAWARISKLERMALVALAQMGDSLSGDLIHFICTELQVDESSVINALEETKFATRFDYATQFDMRLQASALAFLSSAAQRLKPEEKAIVDLAVAHASQRRAELIRAHGRTVYDRVPQAFQTDAAKAARQAAVQGLLDDAVFWYEEALKVEPGNAQLLDRFAFFLATKVRNLERAWLLAEEACRLDPEYADGYFNAGHIAASRGDIRAADERLQKARNLGIPAHRCNLQSARARIREVEISIERGPGRAYDAASKLKEASNLLRKADLLWRENDLDRKHQYEVDQARIKVRSLGRRFGLALP
jgi:Tfp pilus assembly protein PilF